MKKMLLILWAMFTAMPMFAQQTKIKTIADQMAAATAKGDFKTVVDHTDPAIVAKAGGKEVMIKTVTNMFAAMKKQGIALKSASAGVPGAIINAGGKQFCLVPETVSMLVPQSQMMPKGVYTVTSSLLAVSDDKGKKWYFVNSNKMTDETLYQMYPQLKGKLSMPPSNAPKFTPVE